MTTTRMQIMLRSHIQNENPVVQAMVQRHRDIFMSRAFPPSQTDDVDNLLWCRPQEEHDYIEHVLTHWQTGVNGYSYGQPPHNIASLLVLGLCCSGDHHWKRLGELIQEMQGNK